jgi:hypothetical protein
MFKLLGRKREAKGMEDKAQGESQGGVVTEDKAKDAPLVEQVSSLLEHESASSSASVRSIIKAAISSAEQIVDSVKIQVEAEARKEAGKIIAEAKEEAEKIRGGVSPAQQEATEEAAAIAEPIAKEETVEPAPAPEEEVVAEAEEEKPEQLEGQNEEAVEEESIPPSEASDIAEPVAEAVDPVETGEKQEEAAEEAPEVVLTAEESQSQYTGEVEINVEMPIEPAIVAKLYDYLQTTPEIKFVRTVGSWNKGSSITIALEKPIPLLATLVARVPGANVLPGRPEVQDQARDRRGAQRINISMRKQ